MSRVLVLFTSSFPFGRGEPFVANELPHLADAFDEIIVVSNDTESDDAASLPPSARTLRLGYDLTWWEKLLSVFGLLDGAVRQELGFLRTGLGIPVDRRALATVLAAWYKAGKFSRLLRRLARARAGAEVHAYAYWANDMAVAAARARARGWVDHAVARAHGWDVYFERSTVGFLPFRRYLARHLDRLLFVSEHGRRYFLDRVHGEAHASVGCARLGTPPLTDAPVGRLRPFTVISCSRMVPLKRVSLIASALAHVSSPTRWIHVGDGETRDEVRALCAHLPDHVEVELPGHRSNAEVLRLYRDVRPSLFVNVSETEGLPVSMMEAMSAGIPVLGTAVGGVAEIVEHEVNGILLSPDPSAQEVAAAMDHVANLAEAKYREYATMAWNTWAERFNADRNYPAFVRTILDEAETGV